MTNLQIGCFSRHFRENCPIYLRHVLQRSDHIPVAETGVLERRPRALAQLFHRRGRHWTVDEQLVDTVRAGDDRAASVDEMDCASAVGRKGAQQQLNGCEIQFSRESAKQSAIGPLRRNCDNQLRALGDRIPVGLTDNLVIGLERLLPIGRQWNFGHFRSARCDDVPIQIENHQFLEVAESFVE
jgi:hypothetical protein